MEYLDTNDFNEFRKYHKNKYNRIIHILCFLIGLVAFVCLFNNYIAYSIIFLYISIIFVLYNSVTLIGNIFIFISIIFYGFKYLRITSKLTLISIIILTYIIPELAHIYFKEQTYLYNRLYREQNIFMVTIQLIKHCINLVPYCMSLKY